MRHTCKAKSSGKLQFRNRHFVISGVLSLPPSPPSPPPKQLWRHYIHPWASPQRWMGLFAPPANCLRRPSPVVSTHPSLGRRLLSSERQSPAKWAVLNGGYKQKQSEKIQPLQDLPSVRSSLTYAPARLLNAALNRSPSYLDTRASRSLLRWKNDSASGGCLSHSSVFAGVVPG